MLYGLPHPLVFMDTPLSKEKFKNLVKFKVMDYWEQNLRNEAGPLTSLQYFKPAYMSLARPHAVWWTAGGNPYEVSKTIVQCKMLSGCYRTAKLSSYWSETGDSCKTIEHILLHCPAYATSQARNVSNWQEDKSPEIESLLNQALQKSSTYLMQFLLAPQSYLK